MSVMQIRGSAQRVNEKIGGPVVAAEIGVREGHNAHAMLKEMNLRLLYLIDSYLPYNDGGRQYGEEEQREYRISAVDRTREFHEKTVFLFQRSDTAAKLFPDGYFDYVYVDGGHDYEVVKNDLMLWLSKVKKGGILAGHDYESLVAWPGVTKAVKEFAELRKLIVVPSGASEWRIEL